ncbi:MAG: methyl-accepting chemotaxis protein [Actinobacteria bacterium]|nr:methyl-accepting chemotaxis protein [Actinomycetota bacterium]
MTIIRSSLRAKLSLAFLAVALVFLVAVAVGVRGVSSVSGSVQRGYAKAVLANEASAKAFNMRISQTQDVLIHKFIRNPDGSVMRVGDIADFQTTLTALHAAATTPADRAAVSRFDSLFAAWKQADAKGIALWQAGRQAQAIAWQNGEANNRGDALSNALFDYANAATKAADADKASAVAQQDVLMGIFCAIALLVAAAIVLLLTRSISRALGGLLERVQSLSEHCLAALSRGLAAVAGGDLTVEAESVTQPLEDVGSDEIGRLGGTFNAMLEQVRESVASYNEMRGQLAAMIGDIVNGSTTVSAASQQMATTSAEAGRAVEEIANAVGEVASGAERQARMVEQAKVSTDATGEAADQAAEVAKAGVAAAEQVNEAVQALRDSTTAVTTAIQGLAAKSEQIDGIVETITGIAGQTNLLALNAAIEAARAGEQGRGFAVVAEEVRKLAEESQQAAASIAGLIGEIQSETEKAVTLVEDGAQRAEESTEIVASARSAFEQIGSAVEDIRGRILDIVHATSEVASVAEQSSASTEQVSASTEETTASTQEIAASAQDLAETAERLHHLVARFKVAA